MRKQPSNFIGIIDIIEIIKKYRKCFFEILVKLLEKFLKNYWQNMKNTSWFLYPSRLQLLLFAS